MNISREKQTKTEGICPVTFHRLRNSRDDFRIFEDSGENQRIPEHFQDAGKQVSDNSEKGAENSRIFRIILQNPLTFGGTGSILYLVFFVSAVEHRTLCAAVSGPMPDKSLLRAVGVKRPVGTDVL